MLGRHRTDVHTAEVGDGEVPLATLGGRILARLVDFAIVFLPSYVVLDWVLPEKFGTVVAIILLEMVVYDLLFTIRTGATPGKRLARIKIVRMDSGAPPGFLRALIRAALGLPASVMPALTALFDERTHRGGHDRLAGTVVIAGNASTSAIIDE
ncbi:RDD family protein [Kibdelosporangium aridum]|uniref:RDD family protein n=1 Tax=Kibdelosporangium aridum TaxID=2030 RepID=A0A428Z7P6_KIBAR|nr:RDD family protein [Kibdelosporangium aridum]RSM83597.1 RDD family protein [Kibdelosporangium aridum]